MNVGSHSSPKITDVCILSVSIEYMMQAEPGYAVLSSGDNGTLLL